MLVSLAPDFAQLLPVILSGAIRFARETLAESKDPYNLISPCAVVGVPRLALTARARLESAPGMADTTVTWEYLRAGSVSPMLVARGCWVCSVRAFQFSHVPPDRQIVACVAACGHFRAGGDGAVCSRSACLLHAEADAQSRPRRARNTGVGRPDRQLLSSGYDRALGRTGLGHGIEHSPTTRLPATRRASSSA